MVRIGIIGTGYMAGRHLAAYRAMDGVEVVGVAGSGRTNVDHFLAQHGIERFYTDYKELLYRERPDAVSIATPTSTHARIAQDCFQAGIHVLCEKPVSLTLQEAQEMICAANRAGRVFMVGFVMRFYQEFREMKRRIDAGEIGEITHAWFRKSNRCPEREWYFNRHESGGIVCEIGTHLLDWMRWMIGKPVRAVSAVTAGDDTRGGNADFRILLEFEDGVTAAAGGIYCPSPFPPEIGIAGTLKSLTIRDRRVVTCGHDGQELSGSERACQDEGPLPVSPATDEALTSEISHFLDCIRQDKEPLVTGIDGLYSLVLAHAALASAGTGKRVLIDHFLREQRLEVT